MHVPDGFLNAPTSVATGAVAAAGVAYALRKARDELDERSAPLAGLTAAFVFAGQMIMFPVGVGTSGHLMGGALAAALVGPWTAILVLSVVLGIQSLLFADGGLTALGTNITLLALTAVLVGWFVTKAVLALLPRKPASVVPAAAIGALLSVPAAATVFVVLFAIGGEVDLPFGTLLATMLGWHVLIGIGEAVITALTVSAVIAVRPDLVFVARGLQPALKVKQADGSLVAAAPEPTPERRANLRPLLVGSGIVSLLLAGLVSFFVSDSPDGLGYVAEAEGFDGAERDHAFGDLPLAGYGEVGGIPVGVAGLLGVVVTLIIGVAIFRLVHRRTALDATGRHPAQPNGQGQSEDATT
jgi:cobalt/nickel transport system permease protein